MASATEAAKRVARLTGLRRSSLSSIRDRVLPTASYEDERVVEYRRDDTIVLRNRAEPEPRRGIYLFGGCDLPAVFHAVPLLREHATGTWVFHKAARNLAVSRSDRQLSLLEGAPGDADELIERLNLPDDYFEPRLFEPTFDLPIRGFRDVPKTVVVLSGAADMIRPLYRRTSTGTLVDPGTGWLQGGIEQMRDNRPLLDWFKAEFEMVPRRSTDEIRTSIGTLIEEVRSRTGAPTIIITNTLTIEPNDPTHNFQLRRSAEVVARRRFLLALDDLVDSVDCRVLDIDRTLKLSGVDEQLDFAHFPDEKYPEIGRSAYQLLEDAQLV